MPIYPATQLDHVRRERGGQFPLPSQDTKRGGQTVEAQSEQCAELHNYLHTYVYLPSNFFRMIGRKREGDAV